MPSGSETVVLDASALLCLLNKENGCDAAMPRAVICAVNLSEGVAKLADSGGTRIQIASVLRVLHLRVLPFDEDLALKSGLLRPVTRSLGLSFGDRACIALAGHLSAVAMTADRAWARLDPALAIAVEVIR